jgi:hypothetical protein
MKSYTGGWRYSYTFLDSALDLGYWSASSPCRSTLGKGPAVPIRQEAWWPPRIGLNTYLLTYGAESFLRSRQSCSHSRTSQHFMEPEGSISCSQEPATGPYPEPYRLSPHHPILSKIHFNIVHPHVLVFPVVSFLLAFPPISYIHSSSPPFVLHAPAISSILAWSLEKSTSYEAPHLGLNTVKRDIVHCRESNPSHLLRSPSLYRLHMLTHLIDYLMKGRFVSYDAPHYAVLHCLNTNCVNLNKSLLKFNHKPH